MELELVLVRLLRLAWIAGILPIVFASFPVLQWVHCTKLFWGLQREERSCHLHLNLYSQFLKSTSLISMWWPWFGQLFCFLQHGYMHIRQLLSFQSHFSTNISSYLAGGSNIFSFHSSRLIPQQNRYGVWLSVFLLLLMEVHVSRRLSENLFVFNYSPYAHIGLFTRHVISFYIAAPLSLCCNSVPEAFKFCISEAAQLIVRGKHAMDGFEFNWLNFLSPLMKLGWCQWLGAAIFLWGSIHQHICHKILGSLRENGRKVDEYVIPHGDWFEIVSCPHYLAEIVIYGGLLFASGGTDLTIWLLFLFVVANLGLAAAETHRWYLHKFENYPRNRCPIFPWIY